VCLAVLAGPKTVNVNRQLRALGAYDAALDARLRAVEAARAEVDRLTAATLGDEL